MTSSKFATVVFGGLIGVVLAGSAVAGTLTTNRASINVIVPQITRELSQQTGQIISSAASQGARAAENNLSAGSKTNK
ncbi:MAG: hypothetical protein VCC99_11300 [Alphaproteobacteria bacterium]